MGAEVSRFTPSRARSEGPVERARSLLPVATTLLLMAAWWLSLVVLWRTPLVNLTPAKLLIVAALPLLVVGRVWVLVHRGDRWILGLVAAFVGWFILTALLRGSTYDLKLAGGFVVYFGGPFAIAYAASRARPGPAAIALIAAALVGLGITFVGVVLERVTHVAPGVNDPFAPLWGFVRPQDTVSDLGAGPPPLHTPSGDRAIVRVSSWFAQANYLAYFIVLVAGAAATGLLLALKLGRRRLAIVLALAMAACSVTIVWTYSRAGVVGVVAVVTAVVGLDLLRNRSTWRIGSVFVQRAAPLALVGGVLFVTLLADTVGLRRFVPLVTGPIVIPVGQPPSIERSAAEASAIRLAMQAAAIDVTTADPRAFFLGPGQEAFNQAVHDPTSDLYVEDATGVLDPNSLWLSLGISGGLIAAALLALVLAIAWIRLLLASRRVQAGPREWLACWLAAWLPVWALLQFAGTFPFTPSEATILGTMVGASIGQSHPGRDGSGDGIGRLTAGRGDD
jgi:O-Antigen ligase